MAGAVCVSRYFLEHGAAPPAPRPQSSPAQSTLDSSQELSQSSLHSEDELSLSQMCIEDAEPIRVPPFFNMTPRRMPPSPHYIFEEEFSFNPWAMLIATVFLTKTSGRTARPHMRSFFGEYPTPYDVLDVDPATLERFFENLGLRKRGRMIWRLTYQFVSARWRRASDLPGIGKYGEDAYRMFCLGHTDLEPADRYLRLYLDWLTKHTDFVNDDGVEGSEFVIEDPVGKYYRITLRDARVSCSSGAAVRL